MNVLQDCVILYHLGVEIVQVELQGISSVCHLLSLFVVRSFIAFDAHSLKLTVSISCQTGDFLGLPGFLVREDGLQGEALLLI